MIWLAMLLMAGGAAPLKVATYAYPRYDRAAALAPLGRLLGEELGRPVEITLLRSPDELRDAARAGAVDVAMTNLAAFAGMAADPRVQAVAVLHVPPETLDRYRGVLVARRASGLTSTAGLGSKAPTLRYSEVLPGSTSGGLVQAELFARLGVARSDFADIRQAGTHEAALDDVIAGRADIAALAEEPWRKLQAERPDVAATLVKLWRSEPLPPGPVVCVQSPATACEKIAAALLRNDKASADAAQALAQGWSETAGAVQFKPVAEADYSTFLGNR